MNEEKTKAKTKERGRTSSDRDEISISIVMSNPPEMTTTRSTNVLLNLENSSSIPHRSFLPTHFTQNTQKHKHTKSNAHSHTNKQTNKQTNKTNTVLLIQSFHSSFWFDNKYKYIRS